MTSENGDWVHSSGSDSIHGNRPGARANDYSSADNLFRICTCGKEVVVRTSWTSKNPGRRFCGCPGDEGFYCSSFQWVDPAMCRRSKEVIPALLNRLSQYEIAVKSANDWIE
ncbi:UNVERIFIED_CONTAM: hypothetical protein Slati_2910600 [Sesamum latifolium]|uniref:GRF-type domain-containing protein n=1 Tax=Sesamum latifolium TaxID=2727402 RepID=A0AAW2VDN6_9LAMI